MKSSVAAVLLLVGAVCGQWSNTGSDLARQFQSQDGSGQASFGYSHPGQSSVTHRDAQGNQVGSYAYIDPDGREIRVSYIADSQGFRIVSNDQALAAPAVSVQPLAGNYLQETPEVAAARAAHMAALNAALANSRSSGNNDGRWEEPKQQRWSAPVQQQSWSAPAQQSWSAPAQQTWSAPVQTNWASPARAGLPQETPEVAAARAAHMVALNEALAKARASGQTNEWEEERPVQQQRWSAPVQQQSWSAPAQQTWSAPAQNWAAPQRWDTPQQVQDTPEVAAAKIEFQRAFQQAAALAAQKAA